MYHKEYKEVLKVIRASLVSNHLQGPVLARKDGWVSFIAINPGRTNLSLAYIHVFQVNPACLDKSLSCLMRQGEERMRCVGSDVTTIDFVAKVRVVERLYQVESTIGSGWENGWISKAVTSAKQRTMVAFPYGSGYYRFEDELFNRRRIPRRALLRFRIDTPITQDKCTTCGQDRPVR